MKFKYRKLAFILEWLFVVIFVSLMASIGFFIDISDATLKKGFWGSIGLCLTLACIYSGEYLNRYVEFHNEYVQFNSFRFKRIKNALSINVRYESFYSLEAKAFPLFGVWGIRIKANGIPHPITVSFCFSKHKKLYRMLCTQIKQHNPQVYVDEKLIKYIGDGENE